MWWRAEVEWNEEDLLKEGKEGMCVCSCSAEPVILFFQEIIAVCLSTQPLRVRTHVIAI